MKDQTNKSKINELSPMQLSVLVDYFFAQNLLYFGGLKFDF